jgi:hypothetical protein
MMDAISRAGRAFHENGLAFVSTREAIQDWLPPHLKGTPTKAKKKGA